MSKLTAATSQVGVALFREKAEKAEQETAAERERTAEAQRTLQKEQRRAKQRERGHRDDIEEMRSGAKQRERGHLEHIEEMRSAGVAAQGSAVAVLREQLTHHENEAKAAQRTAISSEAAVRNLQMKAEHVAAERLEERGKMLEERSNEP